MTDRKMDSVTERESNELLEALEVSKEDDDSDTNSERVIDGLSAGEEGGLIEELLGVSERLLLDVPVPVEEAFGEMENDVLGVIEIPKDKLALDVPEELAVTGRLALEERDALGEELGLTEEIKLGVGLSL